MNARLAKIQDWSELAQQANWSVTKLAELCGVSESTLRRHLSGPLGKPPGQWLAQCRFKLAFELIKDGVSIKETASQLGYRHSQTFSREFKKHWGICPGELSAHQTKTFDPRSNDGIGYKMTGLATSISFPSGQTLLKSLPVKQ